MTGPTRPIIPQRRRHSTGDGRYSIDVEQAEGSIFFVRERGFADDETGQHAIALLAELLDAVQADPRYERAHLCVDYSGYRGSSNATRLGMLKRVVSHPAMGHTAFHGARWHTRAVVALLRAVYPRLEAAHLPDRERALDYLRSIVERDAREATPPPGSLLDDVLQAGLRRSSLVMLRLQERPNADTIEIAGRQTPRLRPPSWSWRAPDGAGLITGTLLGDDVLLLRLEGELDEAAAAACARIEDRVLAELGPVPLFAVYDARLAGPPAEPAPLHPTGDGRFSRTLAVGSEPGVQAALRLAGASGPGGPVPVLADLDEAWRRVDELRTRDAERIRSAALPEDPDQLRAVVHRQHAALLSMRETQERLFESIARISWHDTRPGELQRSIPTDPDADDGFWALEGALHLMRQDLAETLELKDRQAAELERASQAAREASRAKSHFLGVVSHELRTPLNAISGLASLLASSDELSGAASERVEGIRTASGRLGRLVEDLLDFTRLESGALGLRVRPFDLASVVEELRTTFAGPAADRGLALEIPVPDGERLRAGDRDRLVQVLSNLLDNAIKFTDRGHVELRIDLCDGEGSFAVTDTGRGIPVEDTERVFRRFEQTRPRPGEVLTGVGLGLNIARHLVRLMGGELVMDSEVDRGTTFGFRIPLRPADEAPVEAPPAGPLPSWPGARVLVVEDDRLSRVVARGLLEHLGCTVTCAEDGESGLRAWEERPVDLVLMDCQLPRMDGYEATRAIRRRERAGRVPVVAMTAHALDEDRARAVAAGMDDFLAKPVSSERLAAVLEQQLPAELRQVGSHRGDRGRTALDSARIADLFDETASDQVQQIRSALARDDRRDGADAAHRLLGQAAWLEAPVLADLCRPLAGAGRWPDDADQQIELVAEEVVRLSSELRRRSRTPAPPESPSRGRLLLVDDDPLVLELTARMLEHLGYRVEQAPDAAAAMALFRTDPHRFSALLLDQRLPGTTGLELLNELRALRPAIPALICSGEPVQDPGTGAGPTRFALKPIRATELVRMLEELRG